MNRNRKIISIILLMLMALLVFPITTFAYEGPTSEFYVNDYAEILDDDSEKFIIENSRKLDQATKAQIVVVTVKSLNGQNLENYANELFNGYGIGDKDKDNGVLIILALKEREFRIEVGEGLEKCLTTDKLDKIMDDYMVPYFKNNTFNTGMLNGYKAVYAEVAAEYSYSTDIKPEIKTGTGVSLNDDKKMQDAKASDDGVSEKYDKILGFAAFVMVVKVIATIVIFIIDLDGNKKKMIIFGGALELGTIIITVCSLLCGTGGGAFLLLLFGTIFNVIAIMHPLPIKVNPNATYRSTYDHDSFDNSRRRELEERRERAERDRDRRERYERSHSSSSSRRSGGGGSSRGSGSSRGF